MYLNSPTFVFNYGIIIGDTERLLREIAGKQCAEPNEIRCQWNRSNLYPSFRESPMITRAKAKLRELPGFKGKFGSPSEQAREIALPTGNENTPRWFRLTLPRRYCFFNGFPRVDAFRGGRGAARAPEDNISRDLVRKRLTATGNREAERFRRTWWTGSMILEDWSVPLGQGNIFLFNYYIINIINLLHCNYSSLLKFDLVLEAWLSIICIEGETSRICS